MQHTWLNKLSPPVFKSEYDRLMTSQGERQPSRVHIETVVHTKPVAKQTDSSLACTSDVKPQGNSSPPLSESDPLLRVTADKDCERQSSRKTDTNSRDCERQSSKRTDINSSGVILKLENDSTETDI